MMEVCGLTDPGISRQQNEDNLLMVSHPDGQILIMVCDGIGGAAAGEVASEMACQIVREQFEKAPVFEKDYQADEWLRRTLTRANDSIYSKSMWNRRNRGMGTTAAGALITPIGTYIFNAGDSRVYALYEDGLIQMSEDHSYVQSLVNENKITAREAKTHEKRNTLTNALGVWRAFRLDVNKIKANYRALLICSDGLHGYVPESKIQRIMESTASLQEQARQLIDLANAAGGPDNITVILTGPGKDYGR